jgi:hypothetical protein
MPIDNEIKHRSHPSIPLSLPDQYHHAYQNETGSGGQSG